MQNGWLLVQEFSAAAAFDRFANPDLRDHVVHFFIPQLRIHGQRQDAL